MGTDLQLLKEKRYSHLMFPVFLISGLQPRWGSGCRSAAEGHHTTPHHCRGMQGGGAVIWAWVLSPLPIPHSWIKIKELGVLQKQYQSKKLCRV